MVNDKQVVPSTTIKNEGTVNGKDIPIASTSTESETEALKSFT